MATLLALLLQDTPAGPPAPYDETGLAAQLGSDWPELAGHVHAPAPGTTPPGDPLMLGVGDTQVALMTIEHPVGDDIAAICDHSRLWPRDEPAPTSYARHTIVTVLGGPEEGGHPALAALLSRVVASAIALDDTVRAVYWGAAEHVVLPTLFRDLARDVLPDPLLPAWVAFNVGRHPDGHLTGHTRGLRDLGLMDIEIPSTNESPEETLDRLSGIAQYLLENGPVIGDGDTLGATADERIVARHLPSAFDEDVTALTLTFDGAGRPPTPRRRRGFLRR